MKMRVHTADLSRALYRVQGVADKKSSMPVLAHVLLEASDSQPTDGALTVSATDLDVGLSGRYPAEVQQAGAVAVPAKQIYEIVKSLPADTIEFERQENNWVALQAGNSRFRLVGMAAEQFSALPKHDNTDTFQIPAADLVRMIDRTLFCVSTDDNRHNLSGIYCESPEPNLLRMVSTDGHRLALAERRFESNINIPKGVIVPRKGFQELKRVLSDSSESIQQVELGFSENSGVLRAGAVTLSTRLVEGQFPDYTQVIPKSFDKTAKMKRTVFADALRRVSLLSQGRAHGVRLKFDNNTLDLSAEDPELGNATESLEVEYTSDPLLMGFNARYLLEALSLVADEGVVLQLTDDLSPGVLKPLEDPGFLAVIMPMRI